LRDSTQTKRKGGTIQVTCQGGVRVVKKKRLVGIGRPPERRKDSPYKGGGKTSKTKRAGTKESHGELHSTRKKTRRTRSEMLRGKNLE